MDRKIKNVKDRKFKKARTVKSKISRTVNLRTVKYTVKYTNMTVLISKVMNQSRGTL